MSILLLSRDVTVPIVSSGLQVYYLFDEGAGQSVTDHSGVGNDGTLGSTSGDDTNDPTWTAEGLSFAVDDYVTTANDASTLPDTWTVCAAVKFDAAVDTQPLLGWSAISSARPAVYLSFLGGSFRPLIYQGGSNFRYFSSSSPVNLQDEGWHFLVFRSPGPTETDIQNTSLRADGETQDVDSTTDTGVADSKTKFRLGAAGGAYLHGSLALLTFHNRELSDSEADQMREFAKQELAGRVDLP